MISMQRSLSSPVRSSPLPHVSPNVAHAPTSPTLAHQVHVNDPGPRPSSSRCPSRPSEATPPHLPRCLRHNCNPRHQNQAAALSSISATSDIARSPFPLPPGAGCQRTHGCVAPATALPADHIPSSPFEAHFHDESQPNVDQFSFPAVAASPSLTLQDLARVVRLSKHQERKRAAGRLRLHNSLVSASLIARLVRCGDTVHRNLVDCFRRDDKDTFVALHNALHQLRSACDQHRHRALQDPDLVASSSSFNSSDATSTIRPELAPLWPKTFAPSFLQQLSSSARLSVLAFLTQLRTNPDYLAARISALTATELNFLLTAHRCPDPSDSVLPLRGRFLPRSHLNLVGRTASHKSDIDQLSSLSRHDALSILIHVCFAAEDEPDGSEDRRRTDVWATVLARLIQQPKSGSEQFLIAVFNIWISMRGWRAKSGMAWYLMTILEDGAFLLDRAEDQHGTRFNLSDWNQSDEVAAEEFYHTAVRNLFGLLDDEDVSAVPEGLAELGTAVLAKLDAKYVDKTSRWLVWRCLFSVFLPDVIVYPESYGILTDYHITPYAREKILKKVAMKAHEYVSSVCSGKPSAACAPEHPPSDIRARIDHLLARFQGSPFKSAGHLSLRPTRRTAPPERRRESYSYLVICPADLSTLINTLFPDCRPQSASSSLRSGQNSVSGHSATSQPILNSMSLGSNLEVASTISTSISSARSDYSASRETLSDYRSASTPQRCSPSCADPETRAGASQYEEDEHRLKLALHEIGQNMGADALLGSRHPCTEPWLVLFISPSGEGLSTHIPNEPEDGREDLGYDNAEWEGPERPKLTIWQSGIKGEDNGGMQTQKPDSDPDTREVRECILNLLENYEVPRRPESGSSTSSWPRSSNLGFAKDQTASHREAHLFGATSPDGQLCSAGESVGDAPSSSPCNCPSFGYSLGPMSKGGVDGAGPLLIDMLKAASAQAYAQAEFLSSHRYWKTMKRLEAQECRAFRENGFPSLIDMLARKPRRVINRCKIAMEEYEGWMFWLKQSHERLEGCLGSMMRRARAMRDKMWFVTDVRNSKEYAYSRDVCQALKKMGMPPRRWRSFQRSRAATSRASGSSYLYQTETQMLDLMAATEVQGGPNKLSDEQAEKTAAWMQQRSVENFCQGEERIHRFCCEVDTCVSKLIGRTIREAPVLWSSELYKREKISFDEMRDARKAYGAMADGGDGPSYLLKRSEGLATGSGWSLRQADEEGKGQSSSGIAACFGLSAGGSPRVGSSEGEQDLQEKTRVSALSSDISPSWPPSRADHGSTSSSGTNAENHSTSFSELYLLTSRPRASYKSSVGRPITATSSTETVSQLQVGDERANFLEELKETLISLLLSDLGKLVLARGSETDIWFRGLGQECIGRQEAMERHARGMSKSVKGEGVEKQDEDWIRAKSVSEKDFRRPDVEHCEDGKHQETSIRLEGLHDAEKSPQGSRHGMESTSSRQAAAGGVSGPEFPFRRVQQQLLTMFCVHPNPFVKLKVLNELKHLTVASLLAQGRGPRGIGDRGSDAGEGTGGELGSSGGEVAVEERIDEARQGRWQVLGQKSPSTASYRAEERSKRWTRARGGEGSSWGGASRTDGVTVELQRLLGDASMRPKSIYRDLQLMASFLPASVLDGATEGKAFWKTGLAALRLKSEVCRTMMETADEAIAAHTGASKPSTGATPPRSSNYGLEDVGRMWAITAREGYPTAQRELALFYLSNPEYVERTTLPLSRPKEVFKQTVMNRYGGSEKSRTSCLGGSGMVTTGGAADGSASAPTGRRADGKTTSGQDKDVRTDAGLMCMAVHWMETAEKGGDELAMRFLRQNEFVGL